MTSNNPQNIDTKTVKKITYLSRISLDPNQDELEKYSKQLSNVIEYISQLNEVDTSEIKATDIISTTSIEDLAEDKPYSNKEEYTRIRNNIINNFPNKQGNLLVLPIRVVD